PPSPSCGDASTYPFNLCQHGQWFFLPWHRAYLGFFEEICQTLTGEKKFGLPYWNWAIDRSIPSPFWSPDPNPLFEHCRDAGPSSTLWDGVYTHQRLESILNEPQFPIFGSGYPSGDPRMPQGMGPLESDHGLVHVFTGGFMGAGGSAFDPLFYTHHCMVDYCWFEWNVNRGYNNPADTDWNQQKWSGQFVNGDGNPVDAIAGLSVLWPLFSYQYEPSQIGTSISLPITHLNENELIALKKRLELGEEIKIAIKKTVPFTGGAELITGRPMGRETEISISEYTRILEEKATEKILLNIGFAEYPESRSFFVRLFINFQEANENTPIEDIHYAGSFGFFGFNKTSGGEHDH
ncbi:MAG TPA: tyrosinase family protein, partial [Puia sp.]|nr:tyrosinase family protein [Puia sp.]